MWRARLHLKHSAPVEVVDQMLSFWERLRQNDIHASEVDNLNEMFKKYLTKEGKETLALCHKLGAFGSTLPFKFQ